MDNAAVMVIAPGVTANVACTGAASAEQDITAISKNGGGKLWIKSDVDCYVIFGVLGLVTTPTTSNSIWLTGGQDYVMDLLATQTAFIVLRRGNTSGTVYWVKVS